MGNEKEKRKKTRENVIMGGVWTDRECKANSTGVECLTAELRGRGSCGCGLGGAGGGRDRGDCRGKERMIKKESIETALYMYNKDRT